MELRLQRGRTLLQRGHIDGDGGAPLGRAACNLVVGTTAAAAVTHGSTHGSSLHGDGGLGSLA